MINYFLLAYQGFDYFSKKFDKKKNQNTSLRIIDNGNKKIKGSQINIPIGKIVNLQIIFKILLFKNK